MPFHHEKLTVYKRALEFATWSQELIESVTKKTSTRDHLERAGDSIALNIAEGTASFRKRIERVFSKSRMVQLWNPQRVSISWSRDAAVTLMQSLEAKRSSRRS